MWNPFKRPRPQAEPDARATLERQGWTVAGTTTNGGFIVTVRRQAISATFRAPSEAEALTEASIYVEARS